MNKFLIVKKLIKVNLFFLKLWVHNICGRHVTRALYLQTKTRRVYLQWIILQVQFIKRSLVHVVAYLLFIY